MIRVNWYILVFLLVYGSGEDVVHAGVPAKAERLSSLERSDRLAPELLERQVQQGVPAEAEDLLTFGQLSNGMLTSDSAELTEPFHLADLYGWNTTKIYGLDVSSIGRTRLPKARKFKRETLSERDEMDRFVQFRKIGSVKLSNGIVDFIKELRFGDLTESIVQLIWQVKDMNPEMMMNNFVSVQSRSRKVMLSLRKDYPNILSLMCEEVNGNTLTYRDIRVEQLNISEAVVTADSLYIGHRTMNCIIHEERHVDVYCVKLLVSTANINGLTFRTGTPSRIYADLLLQYREASLYVVINSTHLWLDAGPMTKMYCKINATKRSDEIGDVIQGKFYDALSVIFVEMLEQFMSKVSRLQLTHQYLSVRTRALTPAPEDLLMMCASINSIKLSSCDMGRVDLKVPSSFLSMLKKHSSTVAMAMSRMENVTLVTLDMCNSKPDQLQQFQILEIYVAYVQWNTEMEYIRKPNSFEVRGHRLNIVGAGASVIMRCVSEWMGVTLDSTELKFVTIRIVNSIIDFNNRVLKLSADHIPLNEAFHSDDLLSVPRFVPKRSVRLESNDISQVRKKRWIWTGSASYILGLAPLSSIQSLQNNDRRLELAEESNAVELGKLENETSMMIDDLRKQNLRMNDLFQSENKVEESLKSLMSDEISLTGKLAHLTRGLETVTDVSMVFHSYFVMVMKFIPELQALDSAVSSALSGTVYHSAVVNNEIRNVLGSNFPDSLRTARVTAEVSSSSSFLRFSFDKFDDEFTVFGMRTLPFQSNTWRVVTDSDALVIVNGRHEFIADGLDNCALKGSTRFCVASDVVIRRFPQSCVERLFLDRSVVSDCSREATVSDLVQSFLWLEDRLLLFSPFADNATVVTGSGIDHVPLMAGTTELMLPPGSFMVCHDLRIVGPPRLLMNVTDSDSGMENVAGEFHELRRSIRLLDVVNMSGISADISDFEDKVCNVANQTVLVSNSMKELTSLRVLNEYHPLKINLENPFDAANTLSYTSMGVILCILLVLVLFCVVTYAPCRTCCSCCCTGICKGLFCCCRWSCLKIAESRRGASRRRHESCDTVSEEMKPIERSSTSPG